jgi:hypothetical protein
MQLLLCVAVMIFADVQRQHILVAVCGVYQFEHASLTDFIVSQIHASHVGVLFDCLSQLDGAGVADYIFA